VTAQKYQEKQALQALAKLGGAAFREEDVIFEGRKIVLPEGTSIASNVAFLKRLEAEQEEMTVYDRTFTYKPWDVAYAAMRAFKRAFGMVKHSGTPGFFGPNPPRLIDVPSGPHSTVQVPWGSFEIPVLSGTTFFTGGEKAESGLVGKITAEGPKKYRDHIEGVFRLIQDELENESLYRGKAFDGEEMPNFLDLDSFNPERIVFATDTATQVEANILAPIRYPDELDRLGLPSKRAVLAFGPYGTGKTSLGMIVAQEAVENGWTFIYARPGRDDLNEAMQTAKLYEPAVVFAEDIDVLADPSDGMSSAHVTKLLDDFDGIASKGSRLLLILTTNHPERIHKGMIRPGRLDAMIHVGAPDAEGIRKLIRIRIPGELLDGSIDWDAVGDAFDGYLPAFVAEAADRAIRYAMARNGGKLDSVKLTTEDLVGAANGLRPQWEMMQDAPEHVPADALGVATKNLIVETVNEALASTTVSRDGESPWAVLKPDSEFPA